MICLFYIFNVMLDVCCHIGIINSDSVDVYESIFLILLFRVMEYDINAAMRCRSMQQFFTPSIGLLHTVCYSFLCEGQTR